MQAQHWPRLLLWIHHLLILTRDLSVSLVLWRNRGRNLLLGLFHTEVASDYIDCQEKLTWKHFIGSALCCYSLLMWPFWPSLVIIWQWIVLFLLCRVQTALNIISDPILAIDIAGLSLNNPQASHIYSTEFFDCRIPFIIKNKARHEVMVVTPS